MGTETEYAVTALDADDRVLPPHGVVRALREQAEHRPHLQSNESGVFLGNGARFYIDAGSHPEYASPETTHPREAVRYAAAGDRLLSLFGAEVAAADPQIACLVIRKGNVDYGTDATWGSHENYLHRCSSSAVATALIPHLVSRIIFSGSGGFESTGNGGLRFVLSPRARFISRLVDASAPGEIALVDTRAQPHCSGFRRQHLMCGDANQSHLSMFLKIGTSALVVALADAGYLDVKPLKLADPLAALRIVARDVTLGARLALAGGGTATALDIQRHYLEQARRACGRLPVWTAELCDLWQDTLDRLQAGPDAVSDRLDWAIKRQRLRARALKRGAPWHEGEDVAGEVPQSAESAESWKAEMSEIDLRYGQVYPPGLFDALDETGVLHHRLVTIDAIETALQCPPSEGRARIRGAVVTRLADRQDGRSCAWDAIRDAAALMHLDLCNPFATEESWRPIEAPGPAADALMARLKRVIAASAGSEVSEEISALATMVSTRRAAPGERTTEHAVQLNNLAFDLRNAGRLTEAEWLMRAALAIDLVERRDGHPKISHRRNNLGTVLLMQGRVAEAREMVTLAWPSPAARASYDLTSARVLTIRLAIAMIDDEPCELYVGQMKSHLQIRPLANLADATTYWQINPVLAVLRPRLGLEDFELLQAIVCVVNDAGSIDALEQLSSWRRVSAAPLWTPWL